jgi:glycosyltransferase involved in cell wall biosynthesis
VRIAFHTPLNAFDDGRISGDRRMARQLADALSRLEHAVAPIADARSYMATPDSLDMLTARADARCEALIAGWRDSGTAPELWFTYHSYYKAPDLLGPAIAGRLGIPYVVAEASDSRRRATGEWAHAVARARASFAAADVHLCFTAQDRNSIAPWLRQGAALVDLPPFLSTTPAPRPPIRAEGPARLVTLAMMRDGVKHQSYLALARTLSRLRDRPWTLTVIGDGPMRAEVEAAFANFADGRVVWRGALPHEAATAELADHDIFVWPGIGEAYGLVYLEAQAAGLPVVAFASGGVPETVRPGETALLVPAGDEPALAAALAQLIDEAALRERMGRAASRFIAQERTHVAAAKRLATALDTAMTTHRSREPGAQ